MYLESKSWLILSNQCDSTELTSRSHILRGRHNISVKAKPKLFLEFLVPQIDLLNRISCETATQLCDLTELDSDLEFVLAQGHRHSRKSYDYRVPSRVMS